jgi:hypothetical protein
MPAARPQRWPPDALCSALERSWRAYYSVTWCASTIAHDSFHSKLYHDYQKTHFGLVPPEAWTGVAAEQQCMKHQLSVMEQIRAPKLEIDHAKQQADGHYVKDKENWEDYQKRSW